MEVASAGKIRRGPEIVRSIEDCSERRLVPDRIFEPKSLSKMTPIDETAWKIEDPGEAVAIAIALPDKEQRSIALGIISRTR